MHKITQRTTLPPYQLYKTRIYLVASSLSDFETLFKCKYPYILSSIWFVDKVLQKGITSYKDLFAYFNQDPSNYEIFLDSGSYSLTSGGHSFTDKKIYEYLDDYIEFVYENKEHITLYCNLDLQFNVKKSKEYYSYLCSAGLHDSVQVHHRPESMQWMQEIIEKYTDPERTVIGASPQPQCSPTLKYEYTKRLYSLFSPSLKIHLLGSVDYKIMTSFNVYSCDSSGASRLASTGGLRTPFGTFDTGKRRSDPQHIYNAKPQRIKQLEEYLNTLGYELGDITGEDVGTSRKRLEITILSYKDTMKKVEENKKLVSLYSRKEVMKMNWSPEFGSYLEPGTYPVNWH